MANLLSILPQQLVFGITLGMVYGLIALGYTMVYGVLFMVVASDWVVTPPLRRITLSPCMPPN